MRLRALAGRGVRRPDRAVPARTAGALLPDARLGGRRRGRGAGDLPAGLAVRGGFEGRSSVRTWLYQIATNTCLTARQHRARRALPSGLGGPGEDRDAELAGSELGWLQPMPGALGA